MPGYPSSGSRVPARARYGTTSATTWLSAGAAFAAIAVRSFASDSK